MRKRRLSSSSVVCSIWKQARIAGISFLDLWPSPTVNRTGGSNTLKQRMSICKYLSISGRANQLKKVTDPNWVLTSGNVEITNCRTLGSWSCQTWFWSCIFLSFAGTGKWEGSQLPAQNHTQQRQWRWCIQLPCQSPSLSSNQILKKKKKKRKVKEKSFEISKSFPGVRNQPCLQISQCACWSTEMWNCDTEADQPFVEGHSHGKVCDPQSKFPSYIQV